MDDESKKKLETVALTDWWIFRRVLEIDAAWRVNVIRLAGLVMFFGSHSWAWISQDAKPDGAAKAWHDSVTMLTVDGAILVGAVFIALRFRVFPPFAKYLTTIADVLLITAAALVGGKSNSGLVLAYPLVIAMTYLRFSKTLTATAVIGCLAGYGALLGVSDATWFDAQHTTPVDRQLVTISTLLLTGVVGWLLCGMAKSWFETQEELRKQRERSSSIGDSA